MCSTIIIGFAMNTEENTIRIQNEDINKLLDINNNLKREIADLSKRCNFWQSQKSSIPDDIFDVIKECPQCGNHRLEISIGPGLQETQKITHIIRCPNCGMETAMYSNLQIAIIAWNNREMIK